MSATGATLKQQSLHLTKSPFDLRAAFASLKSFDELASLLEVSPYQLYHYTHSGQRYKTLLLTKRYGGIRPIKVPTTALKLVQRKLNQVLQAIYSPSSVVHGFVKDRDIVSNAALHNRKRYVMNLDLKDFFESITFPRVRGMFLAKPYSQCHEVATTLARICCYQDTLPQGAPTSPTISNMLLGRLDSELKKLAINHKCTYSRYADDLTFSTFVKSFPSSLAAVSDTPTGTTVSVGSVLQAIIEKNGFIINASKTRLQHQSIRQAVTGLTANRFPNLPVEFVKQTRAMLHAWKKWGDTAAADHFFIKHDYKKRSPEAGSSALLFRKIVKGRIDYLGMVRGRDSRVHLAFLEKYALLSPLYKWPEGLPPRELKLAVLEMGVLALQGHTSQGTAFNLAKFGLVTCAHVVKNQGKLSVSRQGEAETYPVVVEHVNEDLDLALLAFTEASPNDLPRLEIANQTADKEDQIVLMGYPTVGPGLSSALEKGAVTGHYKRFGQSRISISCTIYQGNSGGPVLDRNYRVIGIAANGKSKLDKQGDQLSGVIPTATLLSFLETVLNPSKP